MRCEEVQMPEEAAQTVRDCDDGQVSADLDAIAPFLEGCSPIGRPQNLKWRTRRSGSYAQHLGDCVAAECE